MFTASRSVDNVAGSRKQYVVRVEGRSGKWKMVGGQWNVVEVCSNRFRVFLSVFVGCMCVDNVVRKRKQDVVGCTWGGGVEGDLAISDGHLGLC